MIEENSEAFVEILADPPSQGDRSRIHTLVVDIFQDATVLAQVFAASKALLVLDWPWKSSQVYTWTDKDKDIVYLSDIPSTTIATKPGLLKFGTADGRRHDSVMVLFKPEVVAF